LKARDIKALRKRIGLTQVQFARAVGVSFVTVNRWENGHTSPSPLARKYMAKVAKEHDNA